MPPITRSMSKARATQTPHKQQTSEGPPRALQSFSKFPCLPPELRQMIWACCLPHRVVEMHDSRRRRLVRRNRKCRAQTVPKMPLISRVNFEARSVALRHGSVETMALFGTPVWFDSRRDSINIDCGFSIRGETYDGSVVGPGIQTLACNPDIPLSIDAALIECDYARYFENLTEWESTLYGPGKPVTGILAQWAIKLLTGRKTCSVVLRNVTMHLSHQEACASGLFGMFAEETTIHVDVEDTKQLAVLSELYRSTTTPERWESMRDYFSGWCVKEDKLGFLKCVKAAWLKENEVLPRSFDPYDDPWGDYNSRYFELLEKLPRFTFVIAVHLCTAGYGLKKSDDHMGYQLSWDPSLN
ncbi:hypothetical protein F5Y13DRAFT_201823 [Hypoxylon sp. FL1857]|nr:hypothetical protein F5Y13DRAFT_201823 [Hypoxylon sp. FL1857]